MEILRLIDVPAWILIPGVLLVSLYLYARHKHSYFRRINIRSKQTTLFLGDLKEISKKGLHYVDAAMVQKNGKVFGTFLGNTPNLIVADAEMIKQITVKQFSSFPDRFRTIPLDRKWDKTLPNALGDLWRFQRAKLSPTFTAGKMKNMVSLIDVSLDTLTRELDQRFNEGKEFDVSPIIRDFTMSVICSTGFGLDIDGGSEEMKLLREKSRIFFEFKILTNIPFLVAIFFPEAKGLLSALNLPLISNQILDFFFDIFRDIIKQRRSTKANHRDLMQLMLDAHGGEPIVVNGEKRQGMTDEELMMNSLQFMIAGFDTTANSLIWACYLLATNPECQDKLVQDIDQSLGKTKPDYDNVGKVKYLDMVIKETLRLYPATPRVDRVSNETTTVCGYRIPAGLCCTLQISAVHMLPEYWPEPEMFKPERFSEENEDKIDPYAYLPFGVGPRSCIAKRLAMLEMKMALITMLQKYTLRPGPSLKIPAEINTVGLTKPKDPTYVRLFARETTA